MKLVTLISAAVLFKGSICHLQWGSEGHVIGLSVNGCGHLGARECHRPPKSFSVCAFVLYTG